MYLEADYKWKKGRAKKESWIAPRKKSRAKRRKTVAPPPKKTVSPGKKKVAPKKKTPPPPPKKKKEQSRQGKKVTPKKKPTNSRRKNIAPRKKILAHLYVCGTNICVLIWASKDLIYALKSKVGKCLVFIKVHSNFASFLVSFHGRFLAPEINFEFCNSRADRVD